MSPASGELFYSPDLSRIHHEGYTGLVTSAAPEVLRLLRESDIHSGLVVDLGCGGGILLRELQTAGYAACGIDVSPAMLDIAREVAPESDLVLGSAHTVDLPDCAAITSMGEGLGYIVGDLDPDLPALFRRAFAALAPRGILLFDLVVTDGNEEPMRYEATSEGTGWSVTALVEEDPERSVLTRRIRTRRMVDGVVRETVELHRVRLFPESEVLAELESAGFTATSSDGYGSQRLPPRRRAFIARKLS